MVSAFIALPETLNTLKSDMAFPWTIDR
jgi:hypothetical protein